MAAPTGNIYVIIRSLRLRSIVNIFLEFSTIRNCFRVTCGRVRALVLHHQDVTHLPGQEDQRGGAHVTEESVRQTTLEDLHCLGQSLVENYFWLFLLRDVLVLSHPADAQQFVGVFLEEHVGRAGLTSTMSPIIK